MGESDMTGRTTQSKLTKVVSLVAAAFLAFRAEAQTATPTAEQRAVPSPPPAAAAETTPSCRTSSKAVAGGASVVQAAEESLQHKSWQARGGEIQFTVDSLTPIPADASVLVCFRWKSSKPESNIKFIENRPARLELSGDGKLLKVTTTVPVALGPQPSDVAEALPFVPLAEVRILAIDNKKNELVADATTTIGITHPLAALILAIAAVVLGFVILYIAVARRLDHPGILKANWLLRIISTPSAVASLSQFQILLWTFVVAASAVYVMALSGQLIVITNGMLVLLGIAGAAVVAAKAHNEAQGATAEATAASAASEHAAAEIDKAAAEGVASASTADAARIEAAKGAAVKTAEEKAKLAKATRERADAIKDPPTTQIPRWSDLIVNETVQDDGTRTREIDVTRFQMLLFTVIAAVFVLLNVLTTYVIPEISVGFQTLLGISNGVYMGSKIVQRS
jgi:hypothetical protein